MIKQKLKLIELCSFIKNQRCKLRFNKIYPCVSEYKNRWYFDCLTNICVGNIFKFPKYTTHLTLGKFFNQPTQEWVPNSIIYLIFGPYFARKIIGLPNSIEILNIYSYLCKIKELLKFFNDSEKIRR